MKFKTTFDCEKLRKHEPETLDAKRVAMMAQQVKATAWEQAFKLMATGKDN